MNIDKCPHCGCDAEFTELTNGRYFQCGTTLILSSGEWVRGPACYERQISSLTAELNDAYDGKPASRDRQQLENLFHRTGIDLPDEHMPVAELAHKWMERAWEIKKEDYDKKITRIEKGIQWLLDASTDFDDMKCKARILLADRKIELKYPMVVHMTFDGRHIVEQAEAIIENPDL